MSLTLCCTTYTLAAPCEYDGLVDLITSSSYLSSTGFGVVRVCVNGNKAAVCDYGWGFTDAIVTCVSGGYSPYGKPLTDFMCVICIANHQDTIA